ncbi:MAG: S-layer homology domain-containing protein [Clostridia bacterium]|nr:S-layer homology domain-containing protein [Clostridia bacterium]
MKKKLICLMLILILVFQTSVMAAPYDVQRHWTGSAVNTLIYHGVINGYPDGRFKPDRTITREEVAVILFKLMTKVHYPAEDAGQYANQQIFWDVSPDRWSAMAINYFGANMVLNGYEDGSFRPRNVVTREELASMIYQYTKRFHPVSSDMWANFSDINESFAYEAIRFLCSANICYGYPDGTFRPEAQTLRGEAAVIFTALSGYAQIPVVNYLPSYNVIDVPYISQLSPVYAVVGCEPTSLLMGLKGKGYAQGTTLREFLDNMPKTTSNPAKGFVGSPYVADTTKKTRTTIYPPILAEYASNYGRVSDFSGSSTHELQSEILNGNPVVIYATMRWETPFYRQYNIEGQTQTLLSNNHAVLVCGYDESTNSYYIADPYNDKDTSKEYRYWISGDVLEPIYEERKHAITVE